MMIDKKKLIEVIESREMDFTKTIPIFTVVNIMNEYNDISKECLDFYIEELVSSAGEGEGTCYLDYYDPNADAIILIKDVDYVLNRYNEFPDAESLAEQICIRDEIVDEYRKRFLFLKQN